MKYNINQTFNRLYDIREIYDLKQHEVAKILKINRDTYSKWELNENFIPLSKLNEFCNYFHVSMDYIFRINRDLKKITTTKELDYKLIGTRILFLCQKKDLSRKMLAAQLDISHSNLSTYIRGERPLPTEYAIEIARIYNVSLDWLCGRTDHLNGFKKQ